MAIEELWLSRVVGSATSLTTLLVLAWPGMLYALQEPPRLAVDAKIVGTQYCGAQVEEVTAGLFVRMTVAPRRTP